MSKCSFFIEQRHNESMAQRKCFILKKIAWPPPVKKCGVPQWNTEQPVSSKSIKSYQSGFVSILATFCRITAPLSSCYLFEPQLGIKRSCPNPVQMFLSQDFHTDTPPFRGIMQNHFEHYACQGLCCCLQLKKKSNHNTQYSTFGVHLTLRNL